MLSIWDVEHSFWRASVLGIMHICMPFLFSLSYLLVLLRRHHVSRLDPSSGFLPSPGPSIFLQGFLSCAILLNLIAEEQGHDGSRFEGTKNTMLYKCELMSSLVACVPTVHSILKGHFKTPRMLYYLGMAAVLYSEQLSTLSPTPAVRFGCIAAYLFSFLWESQLLYIAGRSAKIYEEEKTISFFERCSFSWLDLLVYRGKFAKITLEDLPILPADIMAPSEASKRCKNEKGAMPGFWSLLLQFCPREYFLSLLFELTSIICKFSLPWILRAFLTDLKPSTILIFFGLSILDTIATSQAAFQLKKAGAKMKTTIVFNIYDKLLKLPIDREDSKVSIINLVEGDTQRIQDFVQYVHATWSAPLQIIASMGGIVVILGAFSTAAALLAMLVFLPVFHALNLLTHRFQVQIMQKRDTRISLISEIVRNIKGVKLLSIIESLQKKTETARRAELYVMQKTSWLIAASNVILRSAPTLSSVAAFFVASVSGVEMSPDVLFSALLFFGMLTYPLSLLPVVVVYWAGSKASYSRIRGFADQCEVPHEAQETLSHAHVRSSAQLEIKNVSYTWDNDPLRNRGLSNITVSISSGQLVVLHGDMGSGKTTLLNICLGAIKPRAGNVAKNGTVAYMPQNSWLKAGSIRDNILFGRPYESRFYRQVANSCALEQDFRDLEEGDQTEIDTVGSGLSGGQKARVMLARMVYSNADIYLMDDPLAALDSKTKARVVKDVIGPKGILKDKIRIVASSNEQLRAIAHRILTIDNGLILETEVKQLGEPGALIESQTESLNSNASFTSLCDGDEVSDKSPSAVTVTAGEVRASESSSATHDDEVLHTPTKLNQRDRHERTDTQRSIQKSSVYNRFFSYAGYWAWIAVIIVIMISYGANVYSTYILKLVSTAVASDLNRLLSYYAICCAIQALLIFTWLMAAWFLCNYPTSLKMHSDLVYAILHSPMSFFRGTPSGEVLNRFTNDLAKADTPVYAVLYGLFNAGTRTFSTLAIISVFSPLSLLYLGPFLLAFWFLQRNYIRVAVQLRQLDTLSRGPVLTGIVEAEAGRWIIRTFQQVHTFALDQRHRIRRNMTAYFSAVSLEQWLIFRSGLLSSLIIGICPAMMLYMNANAASIGMVMNFILQLSSSLAITAVLGSQLESEMVSVRRILEYCDNKPEGRDGGARKLPSAAWPTKGDVEFEHITASYGDEAVPVLRNVSLTVRGGEKLGIVGRTGAGKSSLAAALLGFLELDAGTIRIDNVDISTLDVDELRRRVSTIPQEPIAFRGTVRSNLDSEGRFDTSDLLRVLQESYFTRSFPNPNEALESIIDNGGSNLSSGQLQLLAIARSLLHKSRILILDEATASVDADTERLIVRAIREHFQDRTVITIAHRLQTIMDSDRVGVMHKGEILELGPPCELYEHGKLFRELVDEAGLSDSMKERVDNQCQL